MRVERARELGSLPTKRWEWKELENLRVCSLGSEDREPKRSKVCVQRGKSGEREIMKLTEPILMAPCFHHHYRSPFLCYPLCSNLPLHPISRMDIALDLPNGGGTFLTIQPDTKSVLELSKINIWFVPSLYLWLVEWLWLVIGNAPDYLTLAC